MKIPQTVDGAFLQEMCIRDRSYIGKKELSPLLEEEKSVGKFVDISSHKTLNEMEKEIIRAVLKEEGMNQVRTALRLGISRTTLWRYLQQS